MLLGGLLAVPQFLLGQVLVPLLRAVAELPFAIVRGLRRRDVTVEAASFAPFRIDYRWTTDPEHLGQVLAQVEGQLARGEPPDPTNALLVRTTP